MIGQTLDLLISMILVILTGSLLIGSLNELWASYKNERGKFLFESIHRIFKDSKSNQFISIIINHPDIHLLRKKGEYPSYIPDKHFVRATLDAIVGDYMVKSTKITYNNYVANCQTNSEITKEELLKNAIEYLDPSPLKTILSSYQLEDQNENYCIKIEKRLLEWYNNYQDRVTGWYKRKIQRRSFWFTIIFCIVFNFDLISIFKEMKTNIALQQFSISIAEKIVRDEKETMKFPNNDEIKSHIKELKLNSLPFGYELNDELKYKLSEFKKENKLNIIEWTRFLYEIFMSNVNFMALIGWPLSALLLTIQSSFWFEVLAKLINIRKTGIKPPVSE